MKADSISAGEKKPDDVIHIENTDGEYVSKSEVIAQDTALAGFTRFQAIKYFWWPALLCLISTLGCMNDGYQNQLPGQSSIDGCKS